MWWVVKKIVFTTLVWLTAVGLSVFIILATPGNPAYQLLVSFLQQGTPYNIAVQMVQACIGFSPDEPIWVSWARYMGNILSGNLGTSITYRLPVTRLIGDSLPWTLFFVSYSLALTVALGITIGLIMAYYRSNVILSSSLSTFLIVLNSIPNWILAAILFVYIGARWRLLPYTGAYDPGITPGPSLEFIANVLHHYTLPALAFILTSLPGWAFSMSAMAVSVLKEDYVLAAKARGLSESRILITYVAKNSILPIYTGIAITFSWLLIGTVWIEAQFLLPGLGSLLSVVIGSRDYPVIIGVYMIFITAMILGNLFTDLTYGLIDPRARVEEE